ncbi:hypothetical protein Sme01_41160 [Sphaerisporangium melleum]|uniref:Uncharacterized protein n=2 Tax=Sphaerisporangium melleum TaxID=321316 RepID=A0A917RCW9_9ACTN|nr:hypothetical protein GCM10007964_48960 [Sphaerisporangium melleum]GII71640.1 hypothetical protein Sme01_41160 [Sphaerisporangium melleum]
MGFRNEVPPPRRDDDAPREWDEGAPQGRDDEPAPMCDMPPPAYFVRSLPIMPVMAWLRTWATARGPFVAGLVLAFAAGVGVALGLRPACTPTPGAAPVPAPPPPATTGWVLRSTR